MMTALRSQQTDVPEDIRRKAKVYEKQQQMQAPKPAESKSLAVSAAPSQPPTSTAPEMKVSQPPKPPGEIVGQMKGSQKDRISDALKRIDAARSSVIRRPGGTK
jgi:hypothetical protein